MGGTLKLGLGVINHFLCFAPCYSRKHFLRQHARSAKNGLARRPKYDLRRPPTSFISERIADDTGRHKENHPNLPTQ